MSGKGCGSARTTKILEECGRDYTVDIDDINGGRRTAVPMWSLGQRGVNSETDLSRPVFLFQWVSHSKAMSSHRFAMRDQVTPVVKPGPDRRIIEKVRIMTRFNLTGK
jgi:hypothetical protein